MTNPNQPLLDIQNLTVKFGEFTAVDRVSIKLELGEILGIVGESGSGKSVTMLAMMGLIAFPGVITADKMTFDGHDLLGLSAKQRRKLIGKEMSMIFQEPMTSLNPCYTVGYQIGESIKVHEGGSRSQRKARVIELLNQVGIPDPERRLGAYPHQLSGGMSQRVMIAMAIACRPKLLIADEPTTALDVTIQAQILDLLRSLQADKGMTLILITHDMGVVSQCAQRVNVMYAGQLMEDRMAVELFQRPRHPYTAALLSALPERSRGKGRLPTIPGIVPGPDDRPSGCLFSPRCFHVKADCATTAPDLVRNEDGATRCLYPLTDDDLLPFERSDQTEKSRSNEYAGMDKTHNSDDRAIS